KARTHALVVVTNSSGRLGEIEALGVRVVNFDFERASSKPWRDAASAWALARILEAEGPDVVHLVGVRPLVLGALALKLIGVPHAVLHVTGEGLPVDAGRLNQLYRAAALRLLASLARRPSSYVLVDNLDELNHLRAAGIDPGPRFAILGGGGVDSRAFPPLPAPGNAVPVGAFVGRMVKSEGISVLMDAFDRFAARGGRLQLELCGGTDGGAVDGLSPRTLMNWCARRSARWRARVEDIVELWREADFLILPAGGG